MLKQRCKYKKGRGPIAHLRFARSLAFATLGLACGEIPTTTGRRKRLRTPRKRGVSSGSVAVAPSSSTLRGPEAGTPFEVPAE